MSSLEDNLTMVMGTTGLPRDQAQQLLEMTGGDVEMAVNVYLSGDFGSAPSRASAPAPAPAPTRSAAPPSIARAPAPTTASSSSSSSSSARAPPKASGSGSGARIATFSSLGASKGGDDEEEEDDADRFFAGGGQAIQGSSSGSLKKAVFDKAKKMGAKEVEESEAKGEKVSIVFYSDGFALQRGGVLGPLRPPSDPSNAAFLRSVGNGEIPDELKSLGADVHVALIDKHTEAYPPQPPPTFTGEGVRVGGSTDPRAVYRGGEGGDVVCDMTQPHTRIQIRLADGTKLVGNFNLTHTVENVYAFVRAARPNTPPFVLSTTYPRADLQAGPVTVADAKLSNAVLMQRFA